MRAWQDLRHGVRALVRQPWQSALAIVALALGIGLTTTMFSLAYGTVWRGLPFRRADRIVALDRTDASRNVDRLGVTIHDFADWRARQQSFDDLAAVSTGPVNISGSERNPERFRGALVTANTFDLLGVRPRLGRGFLPGDDRPGAPPVVVLGYAAWQNRFGGDPAAIGRTLRANGETTTIVGVMPQRFGFPFTEEIWLPLRLDPLARKRGDGPAVSVIGRLKDGVSVDQAAAELDALARQLEIEHPETNRGIGVIVRPYIEQFLGGLAIRLFSILLVAVAGVLLIACVNVANLLLARAALRTREVAIRCALGASRLQVIALLVTEALLLAVAGGTAGVGLAWMGVTLFQRAVADTNPPFWVDTRIDGTVALFVVGLVVAAGLLSGSVPALQASRSDINRTLRDESGGSGLRIGRLSRVLVVVEIALSCGLLVPAGLTMKSIFHLANKEFAFATEDVLTAGLALVESDYPDPASQGRFYDALIRRLAARAGVRAIAIASALPGPAPAQVPFAVEGAAYQDPLDYAEAGRAVISARFFETFGVAVADGRSFDATDRAGSLPVAIVNERFARLHLDGRAVGKRLRLARSSNPADWITIVGVVPDINFVSQRIDSAVVYLPIHQHMQRFVSLAVRTADPPLGLASIVRDDVTALDPNLPVFNVRTMSRAIATATWAFRVIGALVIVFGLAALVLALVGLYGVMSFSVSRRTQEIGIRMALGAHARDVLALIYRQGGLQLIAGLPFGIALAALLAHFSRALLFEIDPWDPSVFTLVGLVILGTGLLACFVPARHAIEIQPMRALRTE